MGPSQGAGYRQRSAAAEQVTLRSGRHGTGQDGLAVRPDVNGIQSHSAQVQTRRAVTGQQQYATGRIGHVRQGCIHFRSKGKRGSVFDEHVLVLQAKGTHVRIGKPYSPIQLNGSGKGGSSFRITVMRIGKHHGARIGSVADGQGAGTAELQVHRQRSSSPAQGPATVRGPAG